MGEARYKPYPAYKHSGVEWLGNIPEVWGAISGKRLFSNRRELSLLSDEQLAASQAYGVVPQSVMMERNNAKVMLALKGTQAFRHVEKNDFVISLRSFEGGIEHSAYTGCVSPAYTVLRPNREIDAKFFRYLLKSGQFVSALQSTTDSLRDGKSITYQQFGDILLGIPSLPEQSKIASYLDYETDRIDELIATQERLIALLEEKRQAVISHAVTKGLNPNAPLRPSGIDWLGDVPENWEVKRVKQVAAINPSKSETHHLSGQTKVTFLPMEYVGQRGEINTTAERELQEVRSGYTYLREGDVCIAKITPCFENGKGAVMIGLKNCIAFATTELIPMRCSKAILPKFLYFILVSAPFNKNAEGSMYGAGGQKRVADSFVANYHFALPSDEEQGAIVAFIEAQLRQFEMLDTKAKSAINLLKERRTALISAAVTGKIDVRDWQSPESIPVKNIKAAKEVLA